MFIRTIHPIKAGKSPMTAMHKSFAFALVLTPVNDAAAGFGQSPAC
jgi:hypothetical protein